MRQSILEGHCGITKAEAPSYFEVLPIDSSRRFACSHLSARGCAPRPTFKSRRDLSTVALLSCTCRLRWMCSLGSECAESPFLPPSLEVREGAALSAANASVEALNAVSNCVELLFWDMVPSIWQNDVGCVQRSVRSVQSLEGGGISLLPKHPAIPPQFPASMYPPPQRREKVPLRLSARASGMAADSSADGPDGSADEVRPD